MIRRSRPKMPLPPAPRDRDQRLGRAADEPTGGDPGERRHGNGDKHQQHGALPQRAVDVGHQIGFLEADRGHQVVGGRAWRDVTEHPNDPVHAGDAHDAGARRAHHGHRRGGNLASDEFKMFGQSAEHHAVSIGDAQRAAGEECRVALLDLLEMAAQPRQVERGYERFAEVQSAGLERQVEGQKAPRMIGRTGVATGAEGGGGTRALQPAGVASGGSHLRIGRAQHLPVRINQRDEGETRCFPLRGRQSEAALSAAGAILEEFGGGGQQQSRTLADALHIARQQCRLSRREIADLGLTFGPLAPAYGDLEPDGRDKTEGDDQEQPNGDRHAADPTAPAQPVRSTTGCLRATQTPVGLPTFSRLTPCDVTLSRFGVPYRSGHLEFGSRFCEFNAKPRPLS